MPLALVESSNAYGQILYHFSGFAFAEYWRKGAGQLINNCAIPIALSGERWLARDEYWSRQATFFLPTYRLDLMTGTEGDLF